jgi:hypothetical protein
MEDVEHPSPIPEKIYKEVQTAEYNCGRGVGYWDINRLVFTSFWIPVSNIK